MQGIVESEGFIALTIALEVCIVITVKGAWYRERVMYEMDKIFRTIDTRARYNPNHGGRVETAKLNAEIRWIQSQRKTRKKERQLEQTKVGTGTYTLCKEKLEPTSVVWQDINLRAIPDDPSRRAYSRHRQLLAEWDTITKIPEGTPRPLGAPTRGHGAKRLSARDSSQRQDRRPACFSGSLKKQSMMTMKRSVAHDAG
eukprot:678442-Amphidinium_carterae.4